MDLETFPDEDSRDAWVTSHQAIAAFTGTTICMVQGQGWAATAKDDDACRQLATALGGTELA